MTSPASGRLKTLDGKDYAWSNDAEKIQRLIQKRKYLPAIRLLREEVEKNPASIRLRRLLSDLLLTVGKEEEAYFILDGIVNDYADQGSFTKAVTLLKKIRATLPKRAEEADRRLTSIMDQCRRQIRNSPDDADMDATMRRSFTAPPELLSPEAVRESVREPEEHGRASHFDAIMNSPLFRGCSPEALTDLLAEVALKTYQPGEIIVTEGETGTHCLMVLVSGDLRVYVRGKNGSNEMVRELPEGSFFGEISLLKGGARTATVTCINEVDILELNRDMLRKLAAKHPGLPNIIKAYCRVRSNSPEELVARNSGG